jgi:hypothetical protein
MTLRIKLSHLVVGLAVGAVLIGAGYALATTRSTIIRACVNSKTRVLTVPARGRCARGTRSLSWNRRGPRGSRGARGATGSAGTDATVSIGTVTTESPGSAATVSDTGTANHAVLNFGIPQGVAGQNGTNATNTGPTAFGEVWMGDGVAQVAPENHSNNVSATWAGSGVASVTVTGCSAQGLQEPIVTVTAGRDPADHLTNANNTPTTAGAYVAGWGVEPSTTVLFFTVDTTQPSNDAVINSDFSFTVYC